MDIKGKLMAFGRKAGFKIKKHSPELLLVGGTISFAGTVGFAIKQTLSCGEIVEEHKKIKATIAEACELDKDYADGEEFSRSATRDTILMWTKTTVAMAKHYLPVMILGSATLTCFFVSNKILRKRLTVAMGSLAAVTEMFEAYRKRVIEEEGVDADRHYRFGTQKITVDKEVLTNSGKKKTVTEEAENIDSKNVLPSDDARIFDASNPNWDKNIDFTKSYLSATENMANMLLEKNGNLFLNEVYDMLGFKRSDRGALVGWIKGEGDGYVDFGFRNPKNRRFINNEENVVLLDFNHQGTIVDKL